jgi:hypothetical protein
MAKKIVFRVKAGQVKLVSTGFSGQSCKSATAQYEAELGQKLSDTPTTDCQASQQTDQRQELSQ